MKMHYGYIAGYDNDLISPCDSLIQQARKFVEWRFDPRLVYIDRFKNHHKERFNLFYLINYLAKENDVITAVYAHNFFSSAREFCSLIDVAKEKGIILTARDLDLDPRDNIDDVCDARILANTETLNIKRYILGIKSQKRLEYLKSLNIGGRNKRVITTKYKQAYRYLQDHTYAETTDKFKLSKATLYRIKKQIEK